MEPSSVEDGNLVLGGKAVEELEALQWSRPQLRTETSPQLSISQNPVFASMEPSSVEDGNVNTAGEQLIGIVRASMEPSSVEDGNCGEGGRQCRRLNCFNGAVLS